MSARVVSIRSSTFKFPRDGGHDDVATVTELANWLDSKFAVPGVGIRFGIDAILGLIPGLGDVLTSIASLYILTVATRYGVPRVTQARMAANIAVDWLLGSIPILGDLLDVAWKANQRNVSLLKRHLTATTPEQRRHHVRDWLFLGLLIAGLVCVLAAAVTVAYLLVLALWRLIV